jgi:hypothetical protein
MLIAEGRKKEIKKALKQAFNQGLRDGRPEIATKASPESSAPTAPGSPERDTQIKREILGQSGGGKVVKARENKDKAFKERRQNAVNSIAKKFPKPPKPQLNVTKVNAKKTFREFLEESAKRRLSFTKLHHGSDSDSIKSIRKSGPKSSKEGSQGPGHYVTPDASKSRKYAEFTSRQRGKKPSVVSYRVPSHKITRVDHIPKKLTKEPQVSSKTPVVHNTRTGHAVIDSDYAKNKIISQKPVIPNSTGSKITKTQPKK